MQPPPRALQIGGLYLDVRAQYPDAHREQVPVGTVGVLEDHQNAYLSTFFPMGADLLRIAAAGATSIGHSAYLVDVGVTTRGRTWRLLPADEQFRCTDDLLTRGSRTEHLVRPGLQRLGAQFDASADGER